MDWTLEVVVLPVSNIDASIAFYRDQVAMPRAAVRVAAETLPAADRSRYVP